MAQAPDTAGLASATNVWAGVGPSETAKSLGVGLGRCSSGPKQMLWSRDVNLDYVSTLEAHESRDIR